MTPSAVTFLRAFQAAEMRKMGTGVMGGSIFQQPYVGQMNDVVRSILLSHVYVSVMQQEMACMCMPLIEHVSSKRFPLYP